MVQVTMCLVGMLLTGANMQPMDFQVDSAEGVQDLLLELFIEGKQQFMEIFTSGPHLFSHLSVWPLHCTDCICPLPLPLQRRTTFISKIATRESQNGKQGQQRDPSVYGVLQSTFAK